MNSGPDWANIALAAATFLAAAIGIGGTAWQAKQGREAASGDLKVNLEAATDNLRLGINADTDRARRADKRQLYASCLAVLNEMPIVVLEDRDARRSGNSERMQVVRFFGAYVKATNDGATIDDSWPTDIERPMPQLKAAMREDLGEAPLADDAEPGSSGELGEAGSDSAARSPDP